MTDRKTSTRGWALLAPALVVLLAGVAIWRASTAPDARAREPGPPQPRQEPELALSDWEDLHGKADGGPQKEAVYHRASERGSSGAVEFLAQASSTDDRLAKNAAEALGNVRNPSSRSALRKAAASPSILASANAIRALGNIAHPSDRPFVEEFLEKDGRLWHEAVRALGRMKAVDSLRKLLEGTTGEQKRLTVLAACRDAATSDLAPALESFTPSTDSERVFHREAMAASK